MSGLSHRCISEYCWITESFIPIRDEIRLEQHPCPAGATPGMPGFALLTPATRPTSCRHRPRDRARVGGPLQRALDPRACGPGRADAGGSVRRGAGKSQARGAARGAGHRGEVRFAAALQPNPRARGGSHRPRSDGAGRLRSRAGVALWRNMAAAGEVSRWPSSPPSHDTRMEELDTGMEQAVEIYRQARAAGREPECMPQ